MGARRQLQRRPTRNGMGWASERLNRVSEAFVDFCRKGGCPGEFPALDLGCGYGAAAVAALAAGATVIAVDLDATHLAETRRRAHPNEDRLTAREAEFPYGLHFEPESLGAVHASSVLHFLTGRKLDAGVERITRWLRPGGRLFVHAATPYQEPFQAFIPEFEARLAAGEKWPGWVERVRDYSSHRLLGQMPRSVHLLTDVTLRRVAEAHGLVVEEAYLYRRDDLPPSLRLDGREGAALVARKV